MVSAATVTAAAGATSLAFFDFLFFLGRALPSDAPFDAEPGAFGAGLVPLLGPSCGAMKFSVRGTASLRHRGGAFRANGAETLGDSVGVNRDVFLRGPCGAGRPCSLACMASNILSSPSASVA